MEEIKVTVGLMNSILQYLGSKPYIEVAPLIQSIQAAAQNQQPVPADVADPAPEVAEQPAG